MVEQLSMNIATMIFPLLMTQVPGYVPYSWVPAMGSGGSVVTPSNITGNTFGVPSGFEFIQYNIWVQDEDEYTPSEGGGVVRLKNSAVDVTGELESGTLIAKSSSYDPTSGRRTVSFIIRAATVGQNQVFYAADKFKGVDTGGVLLIKDANADEIIFIVTVAGPTGSGGGGAG